MRVLHTSDWHIGADLCDKSRLQEHEAFFAWLIETITRERVDVLLVSGDIFDTSSPANRAENAYFNMLHALRSTCCRHVIITGGNHDSPSHLNAPAKYLQADNIHILGCARDGRHAEEVLVIDDAEGESLIVCAVPFLRDRDVRRGAFGQDMDQRAKDMCAGITAHYQEVLGIAQERMAALPHPCAIVGMGHLFARGASLAGREAQLTVGTLGEMDTGFAQGFAYMALGHIHSPQCVGGPGTLLDRVRYSGSILPMNFGECGSKEVLLLDIAPWSADMGSAPKQETWPMTIRSLPIPCFRHLEQLCGGPEVVHAMDELADREPDAWVEVVWTGAEPLAAFREELHEAARKAAERVQGNFELVRILLGRSEQAATDPASRAERNLEDYTPEDIFAMRLDREDYDEAKRTLLTGLFTEVLASLAVHREDSEAAEAAEGPDTAGTAGTTPAAGLTRSATD